MIIVKLVFYPFKFTILQ